MSHFVRYALCIILLNMHHLAYAENITGRSFLTAQPFFTMPTDMTYSLIMDQYHENGSVLNKPQIQTTFFGGVSTDSDSLSRYFLFNDKAVLKVNEVGANDVDNTQDIVGWNFNILTANNNYSSSIALDPKQTHYGVGLSGRYGFKERYWLTVQIPFLSVTNDLRLVEKIDVRANSLSEVLGFDGKHSQVATMIEAFAQREMLYGKIDGPQTKRGFGDTTLTLGYDFQDRSDHYFAPYIGLTIPTSNKPTAEYMWEPVLGNNKHAGVFLGACGHSQIYEKNNAIFWFTWSMKNEYLFPNMQKRSFDLHRGPWTRYLAMYKDNADRVSTVSTFSFLGKKTFGINLMTQDLHVSPGFSNFSTLSLSCTRDNIQATMGSSLFVREAEEVCLARPWRQGPAVADFGNNSSCNNLRTISTMILNDGDVAQQLYITEADINLNSAASSNLISGALFATLGYYTATEHPQLYEVGACYDTSKQNNAINRLALWGKFQITF